MKKYIFIFILSIYCGTNTNVFSQTVMNSRPNIFGGYDYYGKEYRIRSVPNIYGGYNYQFYPNKTITTYQYRFQPYSYSRSCIGNSPHKYSFPSIHLNRFNSPIKR